MEERRFRVWVETAMRLSKEELARACVESFLDCWTLTYMNCSRKVLWQEPDMTLCCTGVPSTHENGVLKARFTSESMATRTKKALEFFKKRRLPMGWIVDPWSTPKGLSRYLQDQGLVFEREVPCMAIYLDNVRREPLPDGLEIHPVTDLKSLKTCAAAFSKGYSEKDIPDNTWFELCMGLGCGPTKRWFTGILGGKPVASSALLLQGGLATVWAVATVEKARGRGIGTAMTREALLSAKKLGYDFAVLQASTMGYPVYRKMGFVEYSKLKTYAWKPR